jgi:hypothetical protein
MGSLADALAGAAAKKGLTVDDLVDAGRIDDLKADIEAGLVETEDCVAALPLAEKPPGAITRRIEVLCSSTKTTLARLSFV